MDFSYRDWFPREPNVGYETLIYDCMIGDQTLFQRADMVEETWRVVQPVLDAWAAKPPAHFPNYAAGSDGPNAADQLLQRDGRTGGRFEAVDSSCAYGMPLPDRQCATRRPFPTRANRASHRNLPAGIRRSRRKAATRRAVHGR